MRKYCWHGGLSSLLAGLTLFVSAVLVPVSASASTVLSFNFSELCERAELIFEGRVIASETRADKSRRGFATYVKFEVVEKLKGPDVGTQLELRFSGGRFGLRSVTVSDMRVPQKGETGIYFVESVDQWLVNPLLGWSQGHFLTMTDSEGRRGVYTAGRRAVSAIAQDAVLQSSELSQQRKVVAGTGVARGVSISQSSSFGSEALSVEAFKNRISASLKEE